MENILSRRTGREPFEVSDSEDTDIGTELPKLAAKSTESITQRRRLVRKAAALTEEEELGPPRKKLQFSASTLLRGLGDDFPAPSSAIATSPHRVSQMGRRDSSTKKVDGLSSQENCYPSPGAAPPATEQRVLRPRIPRRTPTAVYEQVSDSESSDDGLDMLSTTPTRLVGEIASQHQKIWDRAVAAAREKKDKQTRLSSTSSESQRWREETQVDEDDVPRLPPPVTQNAIADPFSREVQYLPISELDSIVDDIGEGPGSSDSAVGASGRGIASAEKKRKRGTRRRNATVASKGTPGKALVWAATGALKT
ncbi:hypothetical protein HDU88_007677 [Geranomyces variabilis]|nr:hypothetical protein HDU88_007677 [Geranomyces variabilis]